MEAVVGQAALEVMNQTLSLIRVPLLSPFQHHVRMQQDQVKQSNTVLVW